MSEYQSRLESEEAADPLFEKARLGVEAETFLGSNVGQYLIKRAEEEIEAAYKRLAECDPFDQALVAHLQNKVRVARAVPQWLAECINEGNLSEDMMREREVYD